MVARSVITPVVVGSNAAQLSNNAIFTIAMKCPEIVGPRSLVRAHSNIKSTKDGTGLVAARVFILINSRWMLFGDALLSRAWVPSPVKRVRTERNRAVILIVIVLLYFILCAKVFIYMCIVTFIGWLAAVS